MDVTLLIETGSSTTRTLRLKRTDTIVGRSRGCGIRIPSSQVSRQHCLLSCCQESLTVEDLGSVNGTFLNGERIRGRRLVRPGDRLEVGPVTFVVQYQPEPATLDKLEEVTATTPTQTPTSPRRPAEASPTETGAGGDVTEPAAAPLVDEDDEWQLPLDADLHDLFSEMEDG